MDPMDEDSETRRLQALVAAARAARPEVSFDEASFLAFVRATPARAAISIETAGDLLLAFACAQGDPLAVRIVEREYMNKLGSLLPARHQSDAVEIVQMVRERVLVPTGTSPPRIEAYSGRGPLLTWLRVAAVRVALNLQRSRRREVSLDEDHVLADRAGGDLEIEELKRRYRVEFREAFTAAMRALSARDRTLLRQHYLDGLTMEAIGTLRRVHRVTIVRWMDAARAALARETRRELGARLRVDRRELESILRLIESQMDMSVRAFLETD